MSIAPRLCLRPRLRAVAVMICMIFVATMCFGAPGDVLKGQPVAAVGEFPPAPASIPIFGPAVDNSIAGVDWVTYSDGRRVAVAVSGGEAWIITIDEEGAGFRPITIEGQGSNDRILRTSYVSGDTWYAAIIHRARSGADRLEINLFVPSTNDQPPNTFVSIPLEDLEDTFSWSATVVAGSIEIVYSSGDKDNAAEVRIIDVSPDTLTYSGRVIYRTVGAVRSPGRYIGSENGKDNGKNTGGYYWKERGATDHAQLVITPNSAGTDRGENDLIPTVRADIGFYSIVSVTGMFGRYSGEGYYGAIDRQIIPVNHDGRVYFVLQLIEVMRSLGPAGMSLVAVDESGEIHELVPIHMGYHILGLDPMVAGDRGSLLFIRDSEYAYPAVFAASIGDDFPTAVTVGNVSQNVRSARFPVTLVTGRGTGFGYFQDEPGSEYSRFRYQVDEVDFFYEHGNLVFDGNLVETVVSLLGALSITFLLAIIQVVLGGAPALILGWAIIAATYRMSSVDIRTCWPALLQLTTVFVAASAVLGLTLVTVVSVEPLSGIISAAACAACAYWYMLRRVSVPSERELFGAACIISIIFVTLVAFDDAVALITSASF